MNVERTQWREGRVKSVVQFTDSVRSVPQGHTRRSDVRQNANVSGGARSRGMASLLQGDFGEAWLEAVAAPPARPLRAPRSRSISSRESADPTDTGAGVGARRRRSRRRPRNEAPHDSGPHRTRGRTW